MRVKSNMGFTLIELVVSASLMVIISMLGLVAFQSSHKSVSLNQKMARLQQDTRDAMRDLSTQVQMAVKRAAPGLVLPAKAEELRVVDPHRITYVVPTDMTRVNFSPVITVRFETEDLAATGLEHGEHGNSVLDTGEDLNENGVLDRRLVIVENGQTRVMGGASSLADVTFTLSADGSTLGVTMVATTRLEPDKERLLRYETSSNIFLMN